MATVSRRIRRNMMAKNLAERALLIMPPVRVRGTDKVERWVPPPTNVPIITYRSKFLRTIRKVRVIQRDKNDKAQKAQALRHKLTTKPREEGSMLRRAFNKIFKSNKGRGQR